MLQFDWLNQYCTLYIRPILQSSQVISTFLYVESREESNEPIFGTLPQLVSKPQSSNGCIECCNLIASNGLMLQFHWLNEYCTPIYSSYPSEYLQVISTFLYVEIHERNRMNLYLELQLNWLEKPQSSNGYIECCNLIG